MPASSWLRSLQAAITRGAGEDGWTNQIGGVIADLERLNRDVEKEFPAVGGSLTELMSDARQLHGEIAGLSAVVSGPQARMASEALVSVRRYVQEMRRRSGESAAALMALQASAASIHRGFSTLGKIALSFHIAAIHARIETAHLALERQDLGNLADEVRACSHGIKSRADQVLETAAAFDCRIAATLTQVSRFEAGQRGELTPLLGEAEAGFTEFENRQRDAGEASLKLSGDLESVSRELGAIATSIQFHDITRQRVEHVVGALKDLSIRSSGGAISNSSASVLRLQAAQLKSASGAFAQSAGRIDRELEDIGGKVAEMADASKRMLGSEQGGKGSSPEERQVRFSNILRAVNESQCAQNRTREILGELVGLSGRLGASVAEVQTIELQLSRISINAAISASHLGAPGEPLNVVAGVMQTLQMQCASRSREAETELGSIAQAIAALTAAETETEGPSPGEALLENLRARMEELRAGDAASTAAAESISSLAEALGRKLRVDRDHARIGRLFSETADRCCDTLNRLAGQARPARYFEPSAIAQPLEERYTMQVERDVHRAAMGAEAAAPEKFEEVEFF